MRVDYERPLSRFMDRLAARMDVAWTHEEGVITIDGMVRRDYRVPRPTARSPFPSELGGTTGTREGTTTLSLSTARESDP